MPGLGAAGMGSHPADALDELVSNAFAEARRAVRTRRVELADLPSRILYLHESNTLAEMVEQSARLTE